jgi:hypothetical protein
MAIDLFLVDFPAMELRPSQLDKLISTPTRVLIEIQKPQIIPTYFI